MAEEHVPNGALVKLGRVEGHLRVGNNARVQAADGKLVVVTESAEFSGNAVVEGDLECRSLFVKRSGKLRVEGNLTVHSGVDVPNAIDVSGDLIAETVDVGGHIRAGSISCKGMRVGGTADVARSLKAETVDVGGKIEVRGELDVKDLQVGGKAEVGGGRVTGTISAGGKFESTSGLEFGDLRIYGVGSLGGDSKGSKIATSGKLDVDGDLQCDDIEISGVTSVSGDCKAVRVRVNGKFDVSGSLAASDKLVVHGMTRVSKDFTGGSLDVGGRLTAERAVLLRDAKLFGSLDTQAGLKASSVEISSGTHCNGPIIGERVEVGESGPKVSAHFWGQRIRIQAGTTHVEDVYATDLSVGPGSRAGKLYALTIELGSGCDVEEVNYVKDLKVHDDVKISHPVRKVDRLKDPPL